MQLFLLACSIVLTILAALVEAKGYLYSFRSFTDTNGVTLIGLAILCYFIGIVIDFTAIYLISKTHYYVPEIMSMLFMAVTIIGVAILSGQFLNWNHFNQGVAVLIMLGLCWLMYQTE